MKQIFNNWEVVIVTEDRWIEGETINLKYFPCEKVKEKGINLTRKVRFDNEAGDMFITIKNKKYFYSEFK